MSKVIIGIHGLANKPKETLLTSYWKTSIEEGLRDLSIDTTGLLMQRFGVYVSPQTRKVNHD